MLHPPSFRDRSRSSRSLCVITVRFVAVTFFLSVELSFEWMSPLSPMVLASSCLVLLAALVVERMTVPCAF